MHRAEGFNKKKKEDDGFIQNQKMRRKSRHGA
jgi:hypothetical protein